MTKKKGSGKKGPNKTTPTSRNKTEKVRSARGRKLSSTLWLQRQLNDPYVQEAQRLGYRSRAAFKIKEIDEKMGLFRPDTVVVDLGAAPGGWCQVALEKGVRKVIALDLLPVDPLPGMNFLQMDFMADEAPEALEKAIGGKADIVLSDMAPNTTGHQQTDHLRIMALVETAYDFATQILKAEGSFVAKVFQGGAQNDLLTQMKKDFRKVRHFKPPSSRKGSVEQFVIAQGYRTGV